jgi:hypothetical protein
MDTIKGKVLEVGNDYENIFHIIVEAQIPEGAAQVHFDQSQLGKDPKVTVRTQAPFHFIATTIGEPALKVGDFIGIKVFYRDEIPPDPNKPTHVVSMDAFTSPPWGQRDKFTEVIRQLCVPCKEHGVHPIASEQYVSLAEGRLLASFNLRVHCPNQECKFYAGNYNPAEWNELMK